MSDFIERSVPFEITRAAGDGRVLEGYAAVFDQPQRIRDWEGEYTETIARGAFAKAIERGRVVLMYEHGQHPFVGTMPLGRIETLREDENGLFVRAVLSDSILVDPVRTAIRDGAITGMSFRASVSDSSSEWSRDRKRVTRTELALFELGPVGMPAYPTTSVAVRMAEAAGLDVPKAAGTVRINVVPVIQPAETATRTETPAVDAADAEPVDAGEAHDGPVDADAERAATPESPVVDAPASDANPQLTREGIEPVSDNTPAPDMDGVTADMARTKLAEIKDELGRMAAKSALTEDDMARLATLNTAAEAYAQHERRMTVKETIAAVAQVTERAKAMPVTFSAPTSGPRATDLDRDPIRDSRDVAARSGNDPWALMRNMPLFGRSQAEIGADIVALGYQAIERMSGASPATRENATQILQSAGKEQTRIARYLVEASAPEFLRATSKLFANPEAGMGQLTAEELDAYTRATGTVGTGNTGGFLVPVQLDPSVIVNSVGTAGASVLRQISTVRQTTRNIWQGVAAGATAWSYDAEGAEVSDDNSTWAQPTITMRSARGFIPFTLELQEDADNLSGELGTLLAEGRNDLESTVFVTGTGASNQPEGVLSQIRAVSGQILQTTSQDVLSLADVSALIGGLPEKFRARASWLAHNGTYLRIKALDTSTGAWQNPVGGAAETLYGRPTYIAEAMPNGITASTNNDLALVGDFSKYYIVDRLGTQLQYIPFVFGSNARPNGTVGWFGMYRNGAAVVVNTAFRLLRV